MRETFKDDDTLVEIQRACGWKASVAVLEIASDPECLRRLERLELVHAMTEDADRAPEQEGHRRLAWPNALLAASVCFVILSTLPDAGGGWLGVGAAGGLSVMAGGIYAWPRRRHGAASEE